MVFHFPSEHHNGGGWAHESKGGSRTSLDRTQAQNALDFLAAHDISHTRKADQIQPGLYLGDLPAAKDILSIESKRISHVLSVCHVPDLTYPADLRIRHKHIDVDDARDEDLLDHFKDCWRFIRDCLDEGGRILVHCEQGISRSPTVVAAYLMRAERMHPVSALTYIKKFRPIIDPNPGFRAQLDVWGNCRGELAGQADYVEWKRKLEQRRR
ncbi:protein of unknown function [Taphrina deformans PYCC 5710]|uniref:protein-tyrosine-phosphatase n=1 Tax=Taphrina deformans (strain PYCC 5710 / ATCC 11124 / CBS 356.35 / IMI 108563 / JCM 9778 / NBRC 8474) TaxID=1097556 RepID=R4XGX4_TAPDE|nr:protein of unknown function [Taphrina deformans PYCC 5710]|eukprot:CCG84943.1 protein of unknown function [Taphrina deformans PYCC 5710]